MHLSDSPAEPVHPAALIRTQQLDAARVMKQRRAKKTGSGTELCKNHNKNSSSEENYAAGGFPPLRLAKLPAVVSLFFLSVSASSETISLRCSSRLALLQNSAAIPHFSSSQSHFCQLQWPKSDCANFFFLKKKTKKTPTPLFH